MRQKQPPREDIPPPLRDRREPYCGGAPPLAVLRECRVTGIIVYCLRVGCQGGQTVALDDLPFDLATTTIVDLKNSRRLVCKQCGGRDVDLVPDWPGDRYKPAWARES